MASIALMPRNHLETIPESPQAEAFDMTDMVNQLRSGQASIDKKVKILKIVTIAVCVAIVAAAIFAAIAIHPLFALAGLFACELVVLAALGIYNRIIEKPINFQKDSGGDASFRARIPDYYQQRFGRAADAIQTEEFQNFLMRNKLVPTQANILDLHELYEERSDLLQRKSASLRGQPEGRGHQWEVPSRPLRFYGMASDFEELQTKIREAGGVPQPDLGIKQDLAGVE